MGMLLFMNPILRLLGASGNTLTFAAQYSFCVIVLGEAGKAGFGIAMGGYPDSDAVGVCILQLQTEAGQW